MAERRRMTAALAGVLLAGTAVLNLPATAQPSETGPLVLVTGVDLSQGGVRRQLIDYWNRQPEHRDEQVKVVELPSRADLQRAQMLAAAQAGDTSYDVLNLDLTWTAEFAENGAIQPLGKELLEPNDFYGPAIDSAEYRKRGTGTEQLWAVPFNTDIGLLFYRKDLLDSAGVAAPKSWQDMVEAKNTVHDHLIATTTRSPLRAAYTTQLLDYDGLTVNAVEAAAAAGENLATRTEASRGLLTLTSRFRDGTILPESTTFDETGSLQAFRDGSVLFMRNWPFAYNVLASDPSLPAQAIGVTRLPGTTGDRPAPAVLGGQNLAVAAHSTKPRLARELIAFLTSPSSQQCLLERGGLVAARRGVYDLTAPTHTPCVLDPPSTGDGSEGEVPTLYRARDAMAALGASLNDAALRPKTPYYSQVTDVLQTEVSRMLATAKGNGPDQDVVTIGDELPAKLQNALEGK